MEKLIISKNEKILIVAPHPDDECIGMGGMLGLFSNQCTVWVLTDGSHGTKDSGNVALKRKEEFIKEMKIVNPYDYHMFEIEDGTLQQHISMLENVDLSCYDKIFVTNEKDTHIDHRAAYKIVKNALVKQNLKNIDLFQFEISEPLNEITHFLDISKIVNYKKKLIECHKSQIDVYDYVGMSLSLNKFRATQTGIAFDFIEGYKISDIDKDSDVDKNLFQIEQKMIQQNKRVHLLSSWIDLLNKRKNIMQYFKQHGIESIIIYGCGDIGKKLFTEITNTEGIDVECFIDRKYSGTKYKGKSIYSIEEVEKSLLDKCGVVVVTVINDEKMISDTLLKCGFDNIIFMQQIIDDMNNV